MKMANTALLVIDMQLGNFQYPDPVYGREKLLSKLQCLIGKARDEGVSIFYVQNKGSESDPDEIGTPCWKFIPPLFQKKKM